MTIWVSRRAGFWPRRRLRFWSRTFSKPDDGSAQELIGLLDAIEHDTRRYLSQIRNCAHYLSSRERGLSERGQQVASDLMGAAEALKRYFAVTRWLGGAPHPQSCDLVEDVLEPALQIANYLSSRHIRMTLAPEVRTAPRVRILPAPARWALGSLFSGLRPSIVGCAGESNATSVAVRLDFEDITSKPNNQQRREIAILLQRSGVVVGENEVKGIPLSLTLRLERFSRS